MSSSQGNTVGCVMKLNDEAHRSYSFAWIVDQPDFCCDVEYKSPEFSTTGASGEHRNIWHLEFESESGYSYVKLHLVNCKEPGEKLRVTFSILGQEGDKNLEQNKDLITTENAIYKLCYTSTSELCHINRDKLFVFCKISIKRTRVCLLPFLTCANALMKNDVFEHKMSDDFKAIMKNERLSDATLVVDGKEFRVHKAILASRSPVFMATFENDMREKRSNRIDIPDVKSNVMQKLLSYIYTNEVDNIEESAEDLIAAAEKYQIGGLKSLCSRVLAKNLNESNAIKTLLLADIYRADDLKKIVLNFIATNIENINEMQGYDTLEKSSHGKGLLHALSAIESLRIVLK